MSLLDDIARAAGGFSTQAFSGPGYETVWSQLKPWFARITTNGVPRWVPNAASQLRCQVPHYENGYPSGPCESIAVETCVVCGTPTCLHHAFIDGEGSAVCYLCVAKMREGSQPHTHKEPPPQQPNAKEVAERNAWWARGVLGIQEGVSWADVKKQHRVLSAQFHPDRPNGDENRYKDVQKAFETLKIIYGEN